MRQFRYLGINAASHWLGWIVCLAGWCWLPACSKQSEYQEIVRKELAKGVRQDSLFLGLQFGMTSKAFFAHCWEYNKRGIFTDGSANTTVLYQMHELKHPASMDFYPLFKDDRIYQMPVVIRYDAWAPWNKHLFSDSLQADVLGLFEQWYGKGFIEVNHSKKGKAFVKVDGNRRISITKDGDMRVRVIFTDLLAEGK
jgi:hypothetical protein